MSWEIEQAESIEDGSKFLNKIGTFHLLVTACDENPASKDGAALNGIKFPLTVLGGTVPNQVDKTFDLMVWNPSPDDHSDMAKKVQTRFALATCLIGQYAPGEKSTVDPTDAVGKQIVAKFRHKQKKNEATGKWEDTDRVELSFSDIWHVDDDYVSQENIPLNQDALKLIPGEFRKKGKEEGEKAEKKLEAAVSVDDV